MKNVTLTPHLGASTAEAQTGVATDIARGVADALHGEPVATAVNASPITRATLAVIQPYFNLCERMGNIGIDLADGRISRVSVEYTGELTETETTPLTTAVLKGLLTPILQQTVNFVNARNIAEERHMEIREVKAKKDITSPIRSRSLLIPIKVHIVLQAPFSTGKKRKSFPLTTSV